MAALSLPNGGYAATLSPPVPDYAASLFSTMGRTAGVAPQKMASLRKAWRPNLRGHVRVFGVALRGGGDGI